MHTSGVTSLMETPLRTMDPIHPIEFTAQTDSLRTRDIQAQSRSEEGLQDTAVIAAAQQRTRFAFDVRTKHLLIVFYDADRTDPLEDSVLDIAQGPEALRPRGSSDIGILPPHLLHHFHLPFTVLHEHEGRPIDENSKARIALLQIC